MSQTSTLYKTVGGIVAFALLAGWSVYRDSPHGVWLRGTTDACAPMAHAFSAIYLAVVGLGAAFALIVAIALFIIAQLGLFQGSSGAMKSFARTMLFCVGGLALAALLYLPIEAMFPQKPRPECPAAMAAPSGGLGASLVGTHQGNDAGQQNHQPNDLA